MGDKLTPEELAEFREIFNLVDKDGGGTISKEELGELMETLGIDATPEEIDLMIAEIDEDNTAISAIMTLSRDCAVISLEDTRQDAINIMAARRVRHLVRGGTR